MRSPRRTTRTVLALLATGVLLSSCSGGGSDAQVAGGSADKAPQPSAPRAGGTSADGDGAVSGPDTAARVLPAGRDIVYRGQISVRVKNVTEAANRAESITRAVDGVVFAEETNNLPGSQEESSASLTCGCRRPSSARC